MRIKSSGFTLLEILIALFVFTILSFMMTGALHTVINAQAGAEQNAERARGLQIALVRMSRDISQIINRPVKTTTGKDVPAFVGAPEGFAYTYLGDDHAGDEKKSALKRAQYIYKDGELWRMTWAVLDQTEKSPEPVERRIQSHLSAASFEYLDDKNKFQKNWPAAGRRGGPLPKAIRISLTIKNWGTVKQLYVIPAEVKQNALSRSRP